MLSLFDILFLGAVGLAALYLYLSWNSSYWRKRGIAYDDKTNLIFGSVGDAMLGKKPFGSVFQDIYERYPQEKVVGWFKFRQPGLLVREPDLVRKILVNDFNSFRNNDIEVDAEADPIMGRNLFVLRDELWKKSRALITPAFTAGKIKAMFPEMRNVADELIRYIKQNPGEMHIKPLMSRYTTEIVARCAFGVEGNNFKDSKPEMAEMGKAIFEPTPMKNLKFLSLFLMPQLFKLFGMKMVPNNVLHFFDGILRDVIVHRQTNNIERNDLISYLIEVKRKTIEVAKGNVKSDVVTRVYDDDDVLSGCIMFFVEGYETSALVINNVLYQLALNKDAQDKLRAEVDEVLAEGELTFEKLHAMPYLQSVYAETSRILPVIYTMQKVCSERYEMDVGKDKPLVIEKDTPVIIPLYGFQNDSRFWNEPEKFDPDRFAKPQDETLAKSKGIFMPFSDGPRICPGTRIATTIVKTAIVKIVSEFEILPTSRTPQKISPDPNYFMIAHKGGIFLRFVERSR